jgi:hypothetical protein
MGVDREEQIRGRAYSLWEEEGRSADEDLWHWLQASEEVGEAAIGEMALSETRAVLKNVENIPAGKRSRRSAAS